MSLNTYEIFKLNGDYIISSNSLIQEVKTEKGIYYFALIQSEFGDSPIIHIKHPGNKNQFIKIENVYLTNEMDNYAYNVMDKTKKGEFTDLTIYNDTYLVFNEIKTIDNAEIVLPFNTKNTLRIPFKNGKPFGKSEKKLLISINK